MRKIVIAIFATAIVTVGCSEQSGTESAGPQKGSETVAGNTAMPNGHPPIPATPAALHTRNAPSGSHAPEMRTSGNGEVRQVAHAGGYTYVEVARNGELLWIAGKPADLKVGQKIAWRDGAIMRNFRSKTLEKVFPELMFISSFLSPQAMQQATRQSRGVVRSVEQAAGYSYVSVDTEQGSKWLALPGQTLAQGDRVAWAGGSTMHNFHSKSLNRTFDDILFLSSVAVESN